MSLHRWHFIRTDTGRIWGWVNAATLSEATQKAELQFALPVPLKLSHSERLDLPVSPPKPDPFCNFLRDTVYEMGIRRDEDIRILGSASLSDANLCRIVSAACKFTGCPISAVRDATVNALRAGLPLAI